MRAKEAAEQTRKRRLLRLRDDVTRLRAQHAQMQVDLRWLLETESLRPLSADETRRLRTLRMDSERLRRELQQLWQEFEQVRQGQGK
jgi:hypothetical protein